MAVVVLGREEERCYAEVVYGNNDDDNDYDSEFPLAGASQPSKEERETRRGGDEAGSERRSCLPRKRREKVEKQKAGREGTSPFIIEAFIFCYHFLYVSSL